ncbi:hypothetical protein BASA81_012374 [Batrachochytrium salamandrivorans]|nr:hypothetical protein BASA81_012374 [Batrachochytrium salamandrivorans]
MFLVVGSMNVDLVVEVDEIPLAGETIMGSHRQEFFGGKGANQAVAIARLGGKVSIVGCVGGQDKFGANILANLHKEGVDCEFVSAVTGEPTGVALVTVSKRGGENTVIVVPGANFALRVDHLPIDFSKYSTVMCQNEVPLEVTLEVFRRAKQAGRQTFW